MSIVLYSAEVARNNIFHLSIERVKGPKHHLKGGEHAPFTRVSIIGLITVFDAILTDRQSGPKLQCLYGNSMANNFFQN